jgi:hypothetical protein
MNLMVDFLNTEAASFSSHPAVARGGKVEP